MGLLNRALVAASLLSAVSLGSAEPAADLASRGKQEPCAAVAAAQKKQLEENSRSSSPFLVPAGLAYDCLETVPFKKHDAFRLLDGLAAFWEWQSTIDYLKNPPKGYMMPATDLRARVKKIRNKVANDEYANEYVFQDEMHELAVSVHDSHFNLKMDVLDKFIFRRDSIGPIVSVSKDGKEHPDIYAYYDLKVSDPKGWEPSPIETIDGKDVTEWLSGLSYEGYSQDPDALYNELFFNLPASTIGTMGNFYSLSGEYTGPTTTLGFANGTINTYGNVAAFDASFEDVTDGESFYKQFCNGQLATAPQRKKRDWFMGMPHTPIDKRDSDTPVRAGFPSAVLEHESGEIAGYFLDGDNDDTAVLSISGFTGAGDLTGFSEIIEKFLAKCAKENKSKLIVDVTANGGGAIFLGYDAFKQIFPKKPITDAFNFRHNDQLEAIGVQINDFLDDPANADSVEVSYLRGSPFDIKAYLNMEDEEFKDWESFVGPEHIDEDRGDFTNLARWNFNDKPTSHGQNFEVAGFLNRTDLPPQVFEAENIVLQTDGTCGSTCTIFAGLMKKNGVRSIVTGGRPRDGPIQAIGGVKGANVLTFANIYAFTEIVMEIADEKEQLRLEGTDLGTIYRDGTYVLGRTYGDGMGARLNVRNAIDPKDPNRVPAQFIYEAADCRIWVTRDMITKMDAMWSKVADTVWGEGACTPGSVPSSD